MEQQNGGWCVLAEGAEDAEGDGCRGVASSGECLDGPENRFGLGLAAMAGRAWDIWRGSMGQG